MRRLRARPCLQVGRERSEKETVVPALSSGMRLRLSKGEALGYSVRFWVLQIFFRRSRWPEPGRHSTEPENPFKQSEPPLSWASLDLHLEYTSCRPSRRHKHGQRKPPKPPNGSPSSPDSQNMLAPGQSLEIQLIGQSEAANSGQPKAFPDSGSMGAAAVALRPIRYNEKCDKAD
jgi:hypothetical protein